MRDEKDGCALFFPEGGKPHLQVSAGQGVQRPERLVEKDQRPARQNCAQESGALPHASRKLGRVDVPKPIQAEPGELLCRLVNGVAPGYARRFETESGVLDRGAPGQEQIALLHVAALAKTVSRRSLTTVDEHRSGVGADQASNNVQQRALARARRPDQRHELAFADSEAQTVEGDETPPLFLIGGNDVDELQVRPHRRFHQRKRKCACIWFSHEHACHPLHAVRDDEPLSRLDGGAPTGYPLGAVAVGVRVSGGNHVLIASTSPSQIYDRVRSSLTSAAI
jgi:hypothetical protein